MSEAHREARREEIVAAATRAFLAKGFARTSMAEVIAASGLSAGLIYGYFSGKRELLAAVAHQVLRRRGEEVDAAIARQAPPSPGEAVELLLRGMLAEGIEPRALVQVWAEATTDPRISTILVDALGIIRGTFERSLRAWFARHPSQVPADLDATVRALVPVMMGLGQGFILQCALAEDFDREAYLVAVRRLLPHD